MNTIYRTDEEPVITNEAGGKPIYERVIEEYPMYVARSDGHIYSIVTKMVLKERLNNSGYLQVPLFKDGKRKVVFVHRLIATAFLDNGGHLPCVNHKDECKTNNSVDNLEWCTYGYNMNYGTRAIRHARKIGKPVKQILCGKVINTFWSAHEAERQTGIWATHIGDCCKGKSKIAGGYNWEYAE